MNLLQLRNGRLFGGQPLLPPINGGNRPNTQSPPPGGGSGSGGLLPGAGRPGGPIYNGGGIGTSAFGTNNGGSSKNPSSTTNTSSNSTTTENTELPPWLRQALQGQYNQASQDAQGSRNFYNSILGGNNSAANLWANRVFNQMLQQATGGPGFTNTGSSAQGVAAAEAAAAVQAGMMDRMFQAANGLNGLTGQTVPFLNIAANTSPKTTTNNSSSTSRTEYGNGEPKGGFRSTVTGSGSKGGGGDFGKLATLWGMAGQQGLQTPQGDFLLSPSLRFLLEAGGVNIPQQYRNQANYQFYNSNTF